MVFLLLLSTSIIDSLLLRFSILLTAISTKPNGVWDRNTITCCCCYPTLARDEGMAEHHKLPEAGQLSRAWTRGRREIESRQRAIGAKSP